MTKCSYFSNFDYFHKESKYGGKYYCQLEVEEENSTLCYFHSKSEKNQNEFFIRFKQYVEKRIKFGFKVFCIGFKFPDFSYHGNGYGNEPGTWVFNNDVFFQNCNFNNLTSFSSSNFQGQNLFDNCTFNKSVDFNGSSFINQINSKDPCTVEFKFCLFNEEVEFVGTRFPIQREKILAKHRLPKIKEKSKNPYRSFESDNKEQLRDFFNKYFLGDFNDKDDIRINFWKLQINSTKINFNFIDRIKHKLFGINRFEKSFCIDNKKRTAIIIIKNQIDKSITTKGKIFLARFFYYEKNFNDYSNAPIDFDYSTFRKRVRFIGSPDKPLSLCAVSFKGVELSNFEFHNVEWIQRRNLLKHRYILIDELLLKKNGNYDEVSNIYNQLRKNYETKLLFNESSNFFIGEMESIRNSLWKKNNSVYRLSALPYFLYKIFALYGESIKLPLIWSFGIIMIIAVLDYVIYYNTDFISAMKNSAFNFLPISWTLPQNSTNLDLYYIEKSLSLLVFGSLFIALRRRFERKK